MSTLSLDDELRKKQLGLDNDQYDRYSQMGIPNPSVGEPQDGGTEPSWASKYGFDDKNVSAWTVAWKVEGTEGGGASSTFAPKIGDNNSGVSTDGVVPTQPSGDVTVQPPNTSGTQVLSSALTGAEQNERTGAQESATDENRQQYLNSLGADGNTNILASTPEASGNRFLDGGVTNPVPAEQPPETGEATLTAENPEEAEKPAGEGTLGVEETPPAEETETPDAVETPADEEPVADEPPETAAEIDNDAEKKAQEEAERKAQEEAQRVALQTQSQSG